MDSEAIRKMSGNPEYANCSQALVLVLQKSGELVKKCAELGVAEREAYQLAVALMQMQITTIELKKKVETESNG